MLRKLPTALLIAALIIATPAIVTLSSGGSDERQAIALTPGAADTGVMSAGDRVEFWRGRVVHESDYLNRVQLATSLLELARQTGDLATYAEAGTVVKEALAANPQSPGVRSVEAAVLFGTHDFVEAFAVADAVLSEDPSSVQALAVGGDALLELGRYAEAGVLYDRLFTEEQGPAVLIRQARLAWHRGDALGAVTRAEQALFRANEARLPASDVAFYALQLATYLFDTGDLDRAEDLASGAVDISPELPAALATLGRVVAATGDLDRAIALFEAAAETIPRPEYLAALGDLHAAKGDRDAAEEQYAAVELIARLGQTEQVVYNRELARFFADHDRQLDASLAAARAEFEDRKDIYGRDTLAWALFKSGMIDDAAAVAADLAALGPQDPRVLYHLGVIAHAVGEIDAARTFLAEAIAINPAFHPLDATHAERLLGDLGDPGEGAS